MIIDIFTSFDPICYNSLFNSIFIWLLTMLPVFFINIVWIKFNPLNSIVIFIKTTINSQVNQTTIKNLNGGSLFISTLFIILVLTNFWGVVPYSFSGRSHLVFTLALSLPLWLGLIISSFIKSTYNRIASFLPRGAPTWLNPFLILIETIRIIVRPLTLAFRIAANIRAGHIVLILVRLYISSTIITVRSRTLILLVIDTFYFAFELGICLVQAFIFCILLTTYSDDHQ